MTTVSISYRNKVLRINPDPVTISLGEQITWLVETDPIETIISQGGMKMRYLVKSLLINVYFNNGTPFHSTRFLGTSRAEAGHRLIIASGPAQKKGDFKYGVNLKNEESNENIEDEDPMIIVR
jgi:hypothetical protein